MATHDYVIDNGTGAAVRTDLNNALAAIVSNNSSSSEPSTKYAYQWWADTTTGILKIRNSSNNGWVELFQLDGTLTLEDGSASTPGLAFRDDLNTGIFSSAADTFDISCGGTTRGSFSSSGLTVTGDVTATTFVGNIDAVDGDFDGTLEADAITVAGVALATVIAGTTLTQAAQTNITSLGTLTGLTLSGDMTFTGDSANLVFDKSDNALEFADNAKAVFGAGSDLTIQSDGSNSLILSDLLFINNAANSENMLKLTANGSVELFENNTKTFETEDSGVRVIGHAGADVTALTDASTITVDFKTGTHFSVTLGGNRTFDRNNTANSIGSSGSIFIIQDGTGSRTASFQSSYKFAGGTAPTLSTAANAVDRLDYVVRAFNDIHCVVTLDVK